MEKLCRLIMALTFLASLQSLALAAPDTYIGDAAIYSAVDTGGTRPKPHVLLLIDNSRATLNRASGVEYNPAIDHDNNTATPPVPSMPPQLYAGTYSPWNVYAADNQGNFSRVEIASTSASLEGITCSTAGGVLIKNTLLISGTYSGSGTATEPNLRGGACDTGPKGATYALGNYLNYLNGTSVAASSSVVKNTYTCSIGRLSGKKYVYETVVDGCIGTFTFTGTSNHTADAATEPGMGADWASLWTQTTSGCVFGATNCSSTSLPPTLTVDAAIPAWAIGASFTPTATFVGSTQREIIYNALAQVVDGSRFAVKFAAMTYNPNNQGGKVVYDMADLSNDTAFNAFKAALPWGGETDGASLISSQTNRPQAEALFDAGYYLGAKYPTTGTISSTAVFPLPNITAQENISSAMAGEYQASNRNECGYNHVILITNGLSNGDNSPKLAPIVDSDGDARTDESVYGGGSHYLDDVAAYLKKQEGIITHTVLAFQSNDPLIEAAAFNGGGEFYNVYDANTLAEALTKLLATIVNEADTSFVAPVVPASSTNRTISSNRVYLGLFKPQNNRPWIGNLKKYGVSSDLALLDRSSTVATDLNGDFLPNSKSFWGVDSADKIMSIDGPLPLAVGSTSGDGGNVAAGGVGGTLLVNLKAGLTAGTEAWVTRNIYTWPTGSASTTLTHADNRFSPTNASITAAMLGLATDTEKDKLIKYVAGADGYDDNNNGNSSEIRDWVLGDILHSKPLIFSYKSYTEAQEGDCSNNKSMIFVGSNDGMFHAFRDCDGKEVWAFIPDNLLPNLKYLREPEHYYFSDSPPTAYVHDVDNDNIIETADGDKVVLIFGQGRGGGSSTLDASGARGAYYAIDVSNPEVPVLLMRIDNTKINSAASADYAELGETWSPPRLAKVKIGTVDKVVAFIGAGYDNNEDLRFGNNMLFPNGTTTTTNTTLPTTDGGNNSSTGSSAALNPKGRGLFAFEVATLTKDGANNFQPGFGNIGSRIWSFVKANDNSQGMDYSIPSDLTVLDMNSDGYHDRIYVGDTGGRLWRFDVGSISPSDWTTSGRIIFHSNKVGGETSVGRKIFYKPTVALLQGIPTLYFGTGDRNHPLNTAVTDRMFAVRDRGQLTANAIDIDNLKNLTDNVLQGTNTTTAQADTILADLTTTDSAVAGHYGWYVDLNQSAGEKVLAPSLVFNKQVFYTTYMPSANEDLDVCQVGNLGESRLYQLDYATAEATFNYSSGNDSSTTYATNIRAKGGDGIGLQRDDRVRTIGVGIPSGIVTLIDASGKITLMISSSNRVGTYQAPSAKMMSPLYWIQY